MVAPNPATLRAKVSMRNKTTIAPVQAGDFSNATKEFGRDKDALAQYSIRRGTLYNLFAQGKIRGVLLRVCGQKSGVRLWDMASIRDYIQSQMADQTGESTADNGATKENGQT